MAELPYIISDEALNDLTEIAIWYEKQRPFLSDEFLFEFYNVSLEKICFNPKAFSKYIRNSNIRRYKMKRFSYRIFYDDGAFPVKIIAIIHTSRSSRYIKRRLK